MNRALPATSYFLNFLTARLGWALPSFVLILSMPLEWSHAKSYSPLAKKEKWQIVEYSGVPANQLRWKNQKMVIKVDKSASPIVYPFSKKVQIKKLFVKGSVDGELKLAEGKTQGDKGNDDFVLRLGLVLAGEQTLPWYKKPITPGWVKKLFSLAPEGSGISHILFLSVVNDSSNVGKSRTHFFHDLLKEEWVTTLNKDKTFVMEKQFPQAKPIYGLWVSADGDDSSSSFELHLRELRLETETDLE